MKKIFFGFAIAAGAMGLYSSALGEGNVYVHETTGVYAALKQDTIPGKKRDTTNRRPMPQDTITRDSAQLVVKVGLAN